VLLDVEEGGFQVGVVELVSNTEAKWAELTALLDNRVLEAHHVDHGSPFLVGLNLLKEVLVDNS
jgi:hypothetical protein